MRARPARGASSRPWLAPVLAILTVLLASRLVRARRRSSRAGGSAVRPLPDPLDAVPEADRQEQEQVVGGAGPETPSSALDAPEADALEQARLVGPPAPTDVVAIAPEVPEADAVDQAATLPDPDEG